MCLHEMHALYVTAMETYVVCMHLVSIANGEHYIVSQRTSSDISKYNDNTSGLMETR